MLNQNIINFLIFLLTWSLSQIFSIVDNHII